MAPTLKLSFLRYRGELGIKGFRISGVDGTAFERVCGVSV
jgi:hypothetical protein